jgi:hypothetical protein
MNHYIRIVLNILFVLFSIGFVGPFLISAPSDVGVIAGIAYVFLVVPAVLYYINRNYVKKIVEKINEV